jgi:acyl carrier protein
VNDLRFRLMRCFAAVFSQLSEQKIATARLDALAGWDSVAAVTLVSTIEEEFETELDLDALECLGNSSVVPDYPRISYKTI